MKGSTPVTDPTRKHVKLIQRIPGKGQKPERPNQRTRQEIVYGQRTQKIEITFPEQGKGHYCYWAVLNLDTGKHLPVRADI
jgi:hypothetical protein